MSSGIIYCLTNSVNGKQYVGQTKNSLDLRWRYHCYYADKGLDTILCHAIRKYGKTAFKAEILDITKTTEERHSKEIFYIEKLHTLAPNGYNMTLGGRGVAADSSHKKIAVNVLGHAVSQETRKKISLSLKGRPVPKERRLKMSAAVRPKHSDETKAKISAALKTTKALKSKTHCKRGHPFNEVNTYVRPYGRACLLCCYILKKRKIPEKLRPYLTPGDLSRIQ